MQPIFTTENGRHICESDAGKRWRCPSCTSWWAWFVEACWICKTPRDGELTKSAAARVET